MVIIKTSQEIAKMKAAGRIVAEILEILRSEVQPGVRTIRLNDLAERETSKRNAKAAFKGYNGYPYSLCCSLNNQVVHGMPSNDELKSGDILSLDFGVVYDGFYGDAAITIPVGLVSDRARKLIEVTSNSLDRAIKFAMPGNRLSDISHAVQSYVEGFGYSVVREFVGHGIGRELHESPQVPNFGQPGRGILLRPGMVLAIEPMINEKAHAVKVLDDGWTAVTCDGGLSAHFEHTVAITDNGPEILSKI